MVQTFGGWIKKLEKIKPVLSVIITSYNEERKISQCLDSLIDQDTDKHFEIIVVDSSRDQTARLIKKRYPDVRLYTFTERKYCGGGRNRGISHARSDIVAFIDADCIAGPDWVDQILAAHQKPYMAIGGSIDNYNKKSSVAWGGYFCEFSRFMPSSSPGWLMDMAGANISYKRDIFNRAGPFIEGTYCSDTEFHWRLHRMGERIRFVPEIRITHQSIERLWPFVVHEYHHGRSFASVRKQYHHFSLFRRMIYCIFSFLIPVKLTGEIIIRVLKNRVYLIHFLRSVHLVVLGIISWSFGECMGYIGRIKK